MDVGSFQARAILGFVYVCLSVLGMEVLPTRSPLLPVSVQPGNGRS